MSEQVRLGIIGFGGQGSAYARFIAAGLVPNMVLSAVADIDSSRAAVLEEHHFGVPFFDDPIALLDSGLVDAVIAPVPHYLHPSLAIAALSRDIHVLVEKPAGVYTKQVAELNAYAATKPHLTFAIMFNQRTNPLYQRLHDIVQGGELGAIRHTSWIITTWWRPQGYYDSSAWRATWGGEGGGVLVNQAPHQLDLWQWICGVPQKVFAKAAFGFRRKIAVEDEVTALVDYGGGATGVFVTATHDLIGTDRFEILCDRGKIVVEGSARATVTRLARDEQVMSQEIDPAAARALMSGETTMSREYSEEVIESSSAWGEQHASVLVNFAANILDGTPLIAPGSDGMLGVRLANAIHLSSWLDREVPIDFDEEEYLDLLAERIRSEGEFPIPWLPVT